MFQTPSHLQTLPHSNQHRQYHQISFTPRRYFSENAFPRRRRLREAKRNLSSEWKISAFPAQQLGENLNFFSASIIDIFFLKQTSTAEDSFSPVRILTDLFRRSGERDFPVKFRSSSESSSSPRGEPRKQIREECNFNEHQNRANNGNRKRCCSDASLKPGFLPIRLCWRGKWVEWDNMSSWIN